MFQKACEDKEISWEMFALLWDKISLKEKGIKDMELNLKLIHLEIFLGLYKLENMNMTNEWRDCLKSVSNNKLNNFGQWQRKKSKKTEHRHSILIIFKKKQ